VQIHFPAQTVCALVPQWGVFDMTSSKMHSADPANYSDALAPGELLTSGGTVDPCSVTSNLHFRFDSATGNTMVDVQSSEGDGTVTQQLVLRGIDLTSRGALTDSQVIQMLFSQGISPEI
jgi:hypothetical protein